jgi:Na+-transporting methylmalonyl-CoA/oxaloacetate decarboxylase gamma subunit
MDALSLKRIITLALGVLVSSASVGMAATSAWQRGGSTVECGLLVSISALLVIGAHLLPSLGAGVLSRLAWVGCVICTLFAHALFVVYAAEHANEHRANRAPHIVAIQQQKAEIRAALDAIRARPLADIAVGLANAHDWRTIQALQTEKREAQRAALFRDELVRLSAAATDATTAAEVDAVTAFITRVSGMTPAVVTLAIGFVFAVCLELLAVALWRLALCHQTCVDTPKPQPSTQNSANEQLTRLRAAIAAGQLRPTTLQIRTYLRCGQANALAIRRQLTTEVMTNG